MFPHSQDSNTDNPGGHVADNILLASVSFLALYFTEQKMLLLAHSFAAVLINSVVRLYVGIFGEGECAVSFRLQFARQ